MESINNNGSEADTSGQRNVWFACLKADHVPSDAREYLQEEYSKTQKNRDNMKSVRKGDVIFYYADGIKAISRATSDAYQDGQKYRVNVKVFDLEKPIDSRKLQDNADSFEQYLNGVRGPFDKNGAVKRGFLFRFTKEAGKLIKDIYDRDFDDPEIDKFFGIDEKIIEEKTIPFDHPYRRELCAIKTKPFIILAGISGTGKSRLVRTLAYKTCLLKSLQQDNRPGNFELIKVKPNWHDTSELVGYMSRINGPSYVAPSFLKFLIKAWRYPKIPFFVCLDEMNLAPVEQYFAEYLSLVETRQVRDGKVYSDTLLRLEDFDSESFYEKTLQQMGVIAGGKLWHQFKKYGVMLPPNLVVMGTVNMDETAHSFSRKVLDRAMTIEMNHVDLDHGLLSAVVSDWDYNGESITPLNVIGSFLSANEVYGKFQEEEDAARVRTYLKDINNELDKTPFKIAYRVRDEFFVYCYQNSLLTDKPDNWLELCLDEMTSMKILSRIEGDQARLGDVLDRLMKVMPQYGDISRAKLTEMSDRLKSSYYTSYWNY